MKIRTRPRLSDIALVRGHTFISSALDAESIVVDAGAHLCEFANILATRFRCRVIALEPNPNLVPEQLEPNVTLLRMALSGVDGTSRLILDENPEGSSIVVDHLNRSSTTSTVKVAVRSVSSIFEEFGLETIDLLKLDIEGSEFDVIRSIDADLASRIRQITVEFHPADAVGESRQRIVDAIDAVRRLGFHVQKASFSGYGDIVFLNDHVFSKPARLLSLALPYYRKGLERGWGRSAR